MVRLYRLRKTLKVALLLTICAAPTSMAAEKQALAPFTMNSIYEFSWSGVPFGELRFEALETKDKYTITADIKLTGLAAVFVKHTSHTEGSGNPANFALGPRIYESNYKTRNKPRQVKITYDAHGHITEQLMVPTPNPAKRPLVESVLKDKALDPLVVMPQLRRDIASSLESGRKSFKMPVYDGNRLLEATFTVEGTENITVGDKEIPVIKVTGTRKPLAGHSQEELENYKKGDPTLVMYFSEMPELMPISMYAKLSFGTLEGVRK